MSTENSARKVNTILKCQEINDIVLSSFGSVGEGDKCLALFTPVPPHLWSFPLSPWLSLSPCLFLIYSSSTIFLYHPPPLPTMNSTHTHTKHWSSGRQAVLFHWVRLWEATKRRSKSNSLIFVRKQQDLNLWSFPPCEDQKVLPIHRTIKLYITTFQLKRVETQECACAVFFIFLCALPFPGSNLDPPIPLQRPGMGSRF